MTDPQDPLPEASWTFRRWFTYAVTLIALILIGWIVAKLTDVGLEVEDVNDPAAKFAPFKVVEVLEAVQHPNADRLRVCQVNTENGMIQVVCGAPNARAGMKAVLAPEGSYVICIGQPGDMFTVNVK